MLLNYEGQEFETLVKEGVTLVDFFATWCGPCKMLMPQLEELAKEKTDVKYVKVDIDQHRPLAANVYKITSVPTLILFKDGVEVSRTTGFAPKAKIAKWIEEHQ
ncbi:MAG: thioredoxin [Acholeplasmataceae bacterium]|jgi:thioredoxin 1|nr:thioredoxin [Acholeplasmataceae bacterium]